VGQFYVGGDNDNLIAITYLLCAKLKHLPRNPWLKPAAS